MWKKILCICIIIICVCTGIGLIWYHQNTQSSEAAEAETQTKNSDTNTTEIENEDKNLENDTITLNEEELEGMLAACIDAGNAVAELENQYINADVMSGIISEISSELYNGYLLNEHDFQWFTPYNTDTVYSWTFVTPYEIDDDNKIYALWECHSSDGDLLAYAVGRYNGETFENVQSTVTSLGQTIINNRYDDDGNINATEEFDENGEAV